MAASTVQLGTNSTSKWHKLHEARVLLMPKLHKQSCCYVLVNHMLDCLRSRQAVSAA